MKNKKFSFVKLSLFLVFSCALCISIFKIGRALAGKVELKLIDAKITEKSDDVTASIGSIESDDISVNTTFHKVGSFIGYKLTFKNLVDEELTIKSISHTNPNPYLEFEYNTSEGTVIKPDDSFEFNFKTTYKNEVTDMTKRDSQESFKFTITFEDQNGNEESKDIIINPGTSDNIVIYFIVSGVSILGIAVLLIKNRKLKKVICLAIVLSPFIAKALTTSIVISFNSNVKLHDKVALTKVVDGSETTVYLPYGESIEEPEIAAKDGYEALGWYQGDEKYDFSKGISDDTEVTLKYKPITYTISYDLDGSTLENKVNSYNVETNTFNIGKPKKQGYVFAGWTGSNGEGLQTDVEINKGSTGNKNYVAHFTVGTETPYKVIHKYQKLDGSYETNTQNLTGVTNSTVTPAIKSKTGFNSPELQSIEIKPDGSSSVTYTYTRISYSLTTNSDVETTFTNSTYPYETMITVSAKEKTGYSFSKWSNGNTSNPLTFKLTGDTTITPTYKANNYTVTYNANNKTSSSLTDTFIYDQTKNTRVNTFSYAGYTFVSWNTKADGTGTNYAEDVSVINLATSGNFNLYAIWQANTNTSYIVRHKYQTLTGTYDVIDIPGTGTTDSEITPALRPEVGFDNPSTKTVKIKGDGSLIVEYIYTRTMYNLTLSSDVNSELSTGRYPYGTIVSCNAKMKLGYTFNKWSNDATITHIEFNLTGDTNLSVIYDPNPYTVTFHSNNGSDTTNVQNFVYDTAQALEINHFINNGFSFAGWSTNNDGTGNTYTNSEEVINLATSGNVDLYAIWVPSDDTSYTVTHKYEQLDGSFTENVVPHTGTTNDTVYPDIISQTGYNDPTVQSLVVTPGANLTYTYYLIDVPFTVTSDVDTSFTEPTYKYGTEITVTAKEKTGYTFSKWSDDSTSNPYTFTLTADTDLSVIYTKNNYTVTFDANNGTGATLVQNFKYDEAQLLDANTFTNTGYSFSNWSTNSDGTGEVYLDTEEVLNLATSGNVDLYANWTPNDDTPYVVYHSYEQLSGPDLVETQPLTGTSNTPVTPAVRNKTGYDSPTPEVIVISPLGDSSLTYYYTLKNLTFGVTSDVDTTFTEPTYKYGTEITVSAKEKTGYTFSKWNNDEISNPYTFNITENTSLAVTYTPNNYTVTFNANNGTGNTLVQNFVYDTAQNLTANSFTKQGYDFAGWATSSDSSVVAYTDEENVSNLATSGNYNLYAVWTPSNNTEYTVTHRYEQLDGSYSVVGPTTNIGTTGDTVYPPVIPETGYVTPEVQGLEILADGSASLTYTYNRILLNFTVNEDVTTTFTDPQYKYGTEITVTAKDKTGYTFSKWNNDNTSKTYTFNIVNETSLYPIYTANQYTVTFNSNDGASNSISQTLTYDTAANLDLNTFSYTGHTFNSWNTSADGNGTSYADGVEVLNLASDGNIDLYAIWNTNSYTVTFDPNNGESVTTTTKNYDEEIGSFPEVTYAGHTLAGWYTLPTGGDQVTISTKVTGADTYYAHWDDIPIICKKATNLHTQTCNRTSGGCITAGYTKNSTVTYGNVPYNYSSGDAYNCDVNGDGLYKDDTERFYYLRTKDNKAVLIYSANLGTNGEIDNANIFNYDIARTLLPTSSLWSNVPEISDGVITRFVSVEDLTTACPNCNVGTTYSLLGCLYVWENTKFVTTSDSQGRTAVWMEPVDDGNGGLQGKRYHNNTLNIVDVSIDTTIASPSQNGVRPVIEIPLENMDQDPTVIFDPNNGVQDITTRIITKGNNIATFPTVSKDHATFNGWWTDPVAGTSVDANTIPTGDVTYYAHYLNSVYYASISNQIITIVSGDNETINITNPTDIGETYTFASSDDTVATVDSSGNVTGVSAGTTSIFITGDDSGDVVTVTVNVLDSTDKFIINFNTNGGNSIAPIEVDAGAQIGTLPIPEKTNYLFDAWYKDPELTQLVTEDTVVLEAFTLYAKWYTANDVARVGHNYFTNLKLAFEDVPTTDTLTDVYLLQSFTDSNTATAAEHQKINLVAGSYTFTYNGTSQAFVVDAGELTISDGLITSNAGSGMINVQNSGKLYVTGGELRATGTRQAIYNNGGTLTISGSAIINASAKERAAVHNLNNGTTYILGGTITSSGSSTATTEKTPNAVYNESGTVYIGEKDGSISTTSPVLQGNKYGVYGSNVYFYDGIIKGKSASFNVVPTSAYLETNTEIYTDHETIGSAIFETSILKVKEQEQYSITLDPSGSSVNPNALVINKGSSLTSLPTPDSAANYNFDGWYTEADGGTQVTTSTVPEGDATYYARWIYTGTEDTNVVTFRTTPDVQIDYYANIDSWKLDSSNFPTWSSSNNSPDWALDATENAIMKTKFDYYNCECADGQCTSTGTVKCDKPKGYNTNQSGSLNVYTYNPSTKVRGKLALYANADNGVIYNLIPDQVYYWELDSNKSVHGFVKFNSERRILDTGDVRNTRDLGGLPADSDGDGVVDGHLKYGKLVRGIKLSSASSVTQLENLGLTEELDLREANSDSNKLSKYKRIEAQNYYVNPAHTTNTTEMNYYNMTRDAVKYAMEEVVKGENLYFHCRIGTDRTGTIAYVLEGLLGVPEEDRIQDYELSFFYGLIRIHRYHNIKPGSSVGTGNERFVYMHDFMPSNSDIYDWYMAGSTNTVEDTKLINDFRAAMIENS